MHRLQRVFVALGFAATLLAPTVVQAQPGERAATQLFVGPTARVLPKGDGYFKTVGLSMPYLQAGLTDRFSVGLGLPLYGLAQTVFVSPKFQLLKTGNQLTSIGAVEVISPYGSGGVGYLAHTVELSTGAIHMAVIKPLDHFTVSRGAALMVGAEARVSPRITLMTENYFLPEARPMITGGIRLHTSRTTWDFGWFVPLGFQYGRPGAPMINAGWKF